MLIPEPKQSSFADSPLKIAFNGESKLHIDCDPRFRYARELVILLGSELGGGRPFSDNSNQSRSKFSVRVRYPLKSDRDFFSSIEHSDEAYILRINRNRAEIIAIEHAGTVNGAMTLRQLMQWHGDVLSIQEGKIRDWPDFRIRAGARWTLCGEATRWALDYGDGIENFLRRTKAQIDFLMRHKINAVFFDGFTLNSNRFPGYLEMVTELNSYAALRNVRLIFGFYGIGFGGYGGGNMLAEAHNFPPGAGGDFNRTSYPNGPKYPCCGNNPKNAETRCNGTCRSNPGLAERKRQMVMDYVRKIRPRALYIHHEDLAAFEETQKTFWENRCPECRAKWPDDRLESIRGGAAALAFGYDVLCEAVASVKDEATGYDGARDCLIVLCSPAYGLGYDPDSQWDKTVELWTNISKKMRYSKNICFGMREQFQRENVEDGCRIAQLAQALSQTGKQHAIFLFVVSGSDLYANDTQFSATAVLNRYFLGSAAIFNFNGLPFQEPQVLINSEYDWNADSDYYRLNETYSSAAESYQHYFTFCRKRQIPAAFTRRGGILEKLCKHLYGVQAAPYMKKFQMLGVRTELAPLYILYYRFSIVKFFKIYDQEYSKRRARNFRKWQKIQSLTKDGAALVKKALQSGTLNNQSEILERLVCTLTVGLKFAEISTMMFQDKINKQQILARLNALDKHINQLPREFFPDSGDAALWPEYIEKFRALLNKNNPSIQQEEK